MSRPAVVFGMNSLFAVRQFLPEVMEAVRHKGFEVLVIAPTPSSAADDPRLGGPGVSIRTISMRREIAPISDLKALIEIYRILRTLRPVIANMSTPKMGLVGGLAAWLARVPHRIYTLRGLRYETTHLWKRLLLKWCERAACGAAHHVLCISRSVRDSVLRDRLTRPDKAIILDRRGSEGIAIPPPGQKNDDEALRRRIGIPVGGRVLGFVGRLTRDKGVRELVECVKILNQEGRQVHLLLLGEFERGDPVDSATEQWIRSDPGCHWLGFVPEPGPYFKLMDVFVLPTYREGLPKVLLEAAVAGTPVVSTRVSGVVDIIEDGRTGLLVPSGDPVQLAGAVRRLLCNGALANRLSVAAKTLVKEEFDNSVYLERIANMFASLAGNQDSHRSSFADSDPQSSQGVKLNAASADL